MGDMQQLFEAYHRPKSVVAKSVGLADRMSFYVEFSLLHQSMEVLMELGHFFLDDRLISVSFSSERME